MHWTYEELHTLPTSVYDELVLWLHEQARERADAWDG